MAPLARQRTGLLCRILIVDDNEDAAITLRMLLEHEGHEVAVGDCGARALELAATFNPDIALIDIGLPDMDGYAVAQKIRAHKWGSEVYLIALTGWARAEDQAKALEAGFNLHVAKPVDPAKLDHILNQFDCSKAHAAA
jgi:CheY-like chemotaxis protein